MIKKIKVNKTSNPDNGYTDKKELYNDTVKHRQDVEALMQSMADYLIQKGGLHDWSKIDFFDEFANDCLERLTTPEFKNREWYHIHTTMERHHLNTSCPDDVDLFDVLEMIGDCIIAGKTRSGEVNPYFLILKNGLLDKAYWNTVKKIEDAVILKED